MIEAYIKMLKSTFDYKGLTNRKDYLFALFIYYMIYLMLRFAINNTTNTILTYVIGWIYSIPKISMVVRRLRDAGYKPYECLLWYIPSIVLCLYVLVNGKALAEATIQDGIDFSNKTFVCYYGITVIWLITKIISIFMLLSKTKTRINN